jgi:hypothetical protein
MRTIEVGDTATARDLLDQAHGEPILLREGNGRAFVLVEVDQDDAETLSLAGNAKLERILEHSRSRASREGWLSTEQVRKELGLG